MKSKRESFWAAANQVLLIIAIMLVGIVACSAVLPAMPAEQ
jgi:hypothetical protein